MAKLKTFYVGQPLIRDQQLEQEVLRVTGLRRAKVTVYAVAPVKASIPAMAAEAGLHQIWEREVRVAAHDGQVVEAFREAGLLETEKLLILEEAYSSQHLWIFEPGKRPEMVGRINNKPTTVSGLHRCEFMPALTRYAAVGSIAANRTQVWMKTDLGGDRAWASTHTTSVSDQRMQHWLDLAEVEILRAGEGAWHR